MTAPRPRLRGMGGCPEIVVCDNLRSGVTRPHRYEPDVNATYQEMAAHYGVAVIPTRHLQAPGQGQGRSRACCWPSAGSSPGCATALLLAGRGQRRDPRSAWRRSTPGRSRRWTARGGACSRQSTARRCGRCRPSRYEFATWRTAKVNIDYHVERRPPLLLGALPARRPEASTCAGARRPSRSSTRHKRVASPRAQLRALRLHDRSGPHARVPPPPRRSGRRRASSPGRRRPVRHAAELVEAILAARPHPEQGFRSALGIIRLADRYGTERVEAACARALHLRSYSYRSRRVDPDARPRPPAAARGPGRSVPIPATTTCAGPTTTAE